ncbi:MAG: hypothetical protein IKM13_13050 [Clostridia bacterium]|nr:hypothetical protein [Clostridia bacterium]
MQTLVRRTCGAGGGRFVNRPYVIALLRIAGGCGQSFVPSGNDPVVAAERHPYL